MKSLWAFPVAAAALFVPVIGYAQSAQNLLPPPDQWDLQHSGGANETVAPLEDGAVIQVDSPDGIRNVSLQCPHVHLHLSTSYHFHCVMKSSVDCQVEFTLIPSTGVLRHGPFDQTVAVGPNGTPVDMDFAAEGIGMNDATLVVFLGGCAGQYRITAASIYPEDANNAGQAGTSAALPTVMAVTNTPMSNDWRLQLAGKATAGPIYSAGGVIIDVDQPDGNQADVAYAHDNIDVANGVTYVFHFRARSATNRTIHVEADEMSPDHAAIGLSRDAQLTPTWQEFNLTFTARNVSDGKARVALQLGSQAGVIQISDAAFANPEAGGGPSSRTASAAASLGGLVPVATWDLDTQGSTEAMITPSVGGAIVEIDRADGTPGHVTLRQDGVALADGQTYDLQFKAKATVSRRIPVLAQVDSGSAQMVGLNDAIRVTPVWQDYDLKFTARQPVPDHSRIAFLLGGSPGTVELSDVALQPGDPPVTKVSASLQHN
jgi:hypothetical protein